MTQDSPKIAVQLDQRAAYGMNEFSALFGKETTWSYRLAYKGKLNVIKTLGRMMVPRSELLRILSEATPYDGDKPASAKRSAKAKRVEAAK